MSVQLTLIAPGLLASSAENLAAARSLSTLQAHADGPRSEPRGVAAALLTSLGIADTAPIGPLALLGAGSDPGDDYILCAEPIHLAADRATVVLVQTVDDLSEHDARTLIQMLNRHFAGDDLRFEAVRPNAWFARRREVADIITTPPDAARGRRLFASLPRGPDAGRWKRWQNEIEMLLHEHPINSAREARGEPVVSGVWFWGGGRRADVGALPMTVATGSQGRLGDLARGIASYGHGFASTSHTDHGLTQTMERASALAAQHRESRIGALVVLPAFAENAATLETNWLAPALDLLARHRVDALHLIADGNGAAATWTARAPRFWQRISVRTRRRPFEVPMAPDA